MMPTWLAGPRGRDSDPLDLLRLFVSLLLAGGSVVCLVLWATDVEPRALLLGGLLWALYGFVIGIVDGVLDPVVDGLARAFQNVGLRPVGGGYSGIEAMVARDLFEPAAAAYLERALAKGDTTAMLRRAELLAGPLGGAPAAVAELLNWRETRRLRPDDDIQLGLALADLYEHQLAEPGRAMAELRRLLDRHRHSGRLRRARESLTGLRAERFGQAPIP